MFVAYNPRAKETIIHYSIILLRFRNIHNLFMPISNRPGEIIHTPKLLVSFRAIYVYPRCALSTNTNLHNPLAQHVLYA
jgi:hypothetical protein